MAQNNDKTMAQNNEKNKDRTVLIVILILIALIIIIFLLIKCLGLIDHKQRIPTGNVDIYDIIFGNKTGNGSCNCGCGCCGNNAMLPLTSDEEGQKQQGTQSGQNCNCNIPGCTCGCNNNKIIASTDSNDTNTTPKEVTVFDKETEYDYNTPLNIFKQTAYEVVEDKIAPASENTYQFVVRNNNDFNIMYNVEMTETNVYNVNMRYRLKLNGHYVVGNDKDYVSYEELNQYNIKLASNSHDVFSLDWKWFESSNDTAVGTSIDAHYRLDLKITATQI